MDLTIHSHQNDDLGYPAVRRGLRRFRRRRRSLRSADTYLKVHHLAPTTPMSPAPVGVSERLHIVGDPKRVAATIELRRVRSRRQQYTLTGSPTKRPT